MRSIMESFEDESDSMIWWAIEAYCARQFMYGCTSYTVYITLYLYTMPCGPQIDLYKALAEVVEGANVHRIRRRRNGNKN